ncbi:MAG: TIGR02186 family protein, partial [Shimia sp.]
AIDTTFTGSEILIFGAARRDAPAPDSPLGVVVTVAGPSEPITVRKKDRVAGIWVNTQEVEIDRAPSFYAVATTDALYDTISHTEDLRHAISRNKAIRLVDAGAGIDDPQAFRDALMRIKGSQDAYVLKEGEVLLFDETLFRTSIGLPANLVEGAYDVRIFLTRERAVVSQFETVIDVQKVGLERFLYRLAHDLPLIYGLMSLAIAIFAGWAASAAFQLLRR